FLCVLPSRADLGRPQLRPACVRDRLRAGCLAGIRAVGRIRLTYTMARRVVHLWRSRLSHWNESQHRTEQPMRMIVFIAIIVLCGTGGDLSVSHAMKKIGGIESFRPAAILNV